MAYSISDTASGYLMNYLAAEISPELLEYPYVNILFIYINLHYLTNFKCNLFILKK